MNDASGVESGTRTFPFVFATERGLSCSSKNLDLLGALFLKVIYFRFFFLQR